MTQKEVVREVCSIVALAYGAVGDFSDSSDGFCDKCPFSSDLEHYQNSGKAIDYVRRAVVRSLRVDGHKLPDGFDPLTGKEIS